MYEIGAKIANIANAFAAVVLLILVPALSQFNAVRDKMVKSGVST